MHLSTLAKSPRSPAIHYDSEWRESIHNCTTIVNNGEPGRVPQLVAEVSVSLDAQHVQVDVASLGRVGAQGEAERVRAALGYAAGKVLSLALDRLLDLLGIEVVELELLVELVERDAVDDVERVDDVAQRLAHLAAVRVADDRVQVDVLERQLPCELFAHHDHARHPEEEDVYSAKQLAMKQF